MAYGESRVRRRKKKRSSAVRTAVLVIILAAAVAAVVIAAKKISEKPVLTEVETTEPESSLDSSVTVAGVNISGLGKTQAKIAIEKKLNWDMNARYAAGDPAEYSIANLLEPSIEKKLEEIYSLEDPEAKYDIDYVIDEAQLDAEIEAMKALWNKEALNGTISGYDKETESFTYSEGVDGIAVKEQKLRDDIKAAFDAGNYNASVSVTAEVVKPALDEEAAKAMFTTIGTYTTNSTSNAARNSNLNLACNALDGVVLQPGDEFSFNLTTGNRTPDKGYKEAAAYHNGEVVSEPGGGVCQVASTLYNAIIKSGLEVTERHAHTYAPTYVTPGEDATVSYDGFSGPDLKFTNTTESAVVVRAHYENRTVTCWLIGIPILAEGEEISLHSEKIATSEVPAPVIEDDPTLAAGVQVLVSEGDQGSTWNTYIKHVYPEGSGKADTDELFHVSRYKGHTPKIRRNQSLWTAEYDVVPTDASGETLPVQTMKDADGNTVMFYERESESVGESEAVPDGPGGASHTSPADRPEGTAAADDGQPGDDDLVPGIPIIPSR